MADNWDQLLRVRHEYPKSKSKFALQEVNRRLKKKPHDPYLQAWRADLTLQSGEAVTANGIITSLCQRSPPIADSRLFCYIYGIQLQVNEALMGDLFCVVTPGDHIFDACKNAVSYHHKTRKARLDFWSDFLLCAMREGSWGDVQRAISQVRVETGISKKQLTFIEILAYQLSSEAMEKLAIVTSTKNPKVDLYRQLAIRRLLQAYKSAGSDKDPVQIQDIRDLRFMAQIFDRQNKVSELIDLWLEPPPALEKILKYSSYSDLVMLQAQLLAKSQDWATLADFCAGAIESAVSKPEEDPADNKRFHLEKSWELWGFMSEALEEANFENVQAYAELRERFKKLIEIGQDSPAKDRTSQLARLALTTYVKGLTVADCQSYWIEHYTSYSCYHDLRPFVEKLSRDEQGEFQSMIATSTDKLKSADDEKSVKSFLQVEVNVLKFNYLLTISKMQGQSITGLESSIVNALRLYKVAARVKSDLRFDLGSLAIHCLLRLYHAFVQRSDATVHAYQGNTRLLLQAAVLSLHMTAGEAGDKNRPHVLLSSRVHLTLGLTTIAFQQYNRVPIKQMLLDTTSWILLNRISQIHPFDTTAPKKVLPDEKLIETIRTIETMERKVDDVLFTRLKDFQYDQALDLLQTKHSLRTSISKHLCIIERRRIARLTKKPLDESMELDIKTFVDISDNRDDNMLPDFDTAATNCSWFILPNSMPTGYPTEKTVIGYHFIQEKFWRYINKDAAKVREQIRTNAMLFRKNFGPMGADSSTFDTVGRHLWSCMMMVAERIWKSDGKDKQDGVEMTKELYKICEELQSAVTEVTLLGNPITETQKDKPVDVDLAIHEKILMYWYGTLEQLQGLVKLVDAVQEFRKKNPLMRVLVKEEAIKMITANINKISGLVNAQVDTWLKFLKKNGRQCIRGQFTWGDTGKLIEEIIPQDDLDFYAGEYVDSYVDSLQGVAKVKVGK